MSRRPIHARIVLPCALTVLLSTLAPTAFAHLSQIRQQYESSGDVEPGDRLGRSLAAGDFNGDGYQDLAMGAPHESEDVIDVALHGAVCINYGTAFGLTHLSPTYLSVGDAVDQIVQYGFSLAAGDFDNDGYDDLAVGAPYLDDVLNNVFDAGAVFIYRGGALGLEVTPDQSLMQTTAMGVPQSSALFGWSLAAGDFNNDDYDDLAVGAPGIDGESGKVFHYLFTSNNGIQILSQGSFQQSHLGHTNEPGSHFGWALASANYNLLDGDDLVIGAPDRTLADMVQSGRVYAVRGSATGFEMATAVVCDRQVFGLAHDAGDRFGHALAAGNLAGGSSPDVAIGEPGATVSGGAAAGRVTVVRGVFSPAFNVQTLLQSTGGTGVPDPGDQFGHAVAAGDFDGDLWADLAVGSPFEDVFWQGADYADAGFFQVFPGGADFGLGPGVTAYTSREVNDAMISGTNLGYALAFGKFDDSGKANLAIGAPDREWTDFLFGNSVEFAGQVHVLAPHRQIANRENRASIGVDCTGNIIYSQRMFHPLPIASITKIMTVLLACEAIDDFGEALADSVYTVPTWLAVDMVYGSRFGVVPGEKLTLQTLMELTMAISANDCAWAIGDLLTGSDNQWNYNVDKNTNLATVLQDFANRMNIRADEIGMTRTTYSQPAGSIPLGSAFSCAYDQYLIGREAMKNARFRQIVGTPNFLFGRDLPGNANDTLVAFSNTFLTGLQGLYATADGVKPGSTTDARKTNVGTAPIGTLRIVASVLGVKDTNWGDPVDDSVGGTLADLLNLVDNECDSISGWPGAPPPGRPVPPLSRSGIPTHQDSATTQALVEWGSDLGDVVVELQPTAGTACAKVTVSRVSEAIILPGESRDYSFEALQSHQGFRVTNRGSANAVLRISVTHPPSTNTEVLPPDSSIVLSPYAGPPAPSEPSRHTLTLANTSRANPVNLDVEEIGYQHVGPVANGFARYLNRQHGSLSVTIEGCDGTPGNALFLVIRDADHPVLEVPMPLGARTDLAPRGAPNPFLGSTEIRFVVTERVPVEVRIFDVAGRLVHEHRAADLAEPGPHRVLWDGRDLEGKRLKAGVYLYRVRVGSRQGEGKLTLLR